MLKHKDSAVVAICLLVILFGAALIVVGFLGGEVSYTNLDATFSEHNSSGGEAIFFGAFMVILASVVLYKA